MMRRLTASGAAVALALAAAWASAPRTAAMGRPGVNPVPCPAQEWLIGDPAFEPLTDARAFFGRYDGGIYRVEIPDDWNGDLVLYAHGFASNAGANGSSLRVGSHPIREHLVKNGFAWAASSYRCNGYVPGQGLVDTMALTEVFTRANGGQAPRRTYLTGTSMGGHVTLLGMQEFPTAFAGGLAMCPAGSELFDYFAAVSAAAEVITGVRFSREKLAEDAAKMAEALGKPPDYSAKGLALASVEIQMSGGPRPFALEGLASRFLQNATTSHGALVGVDSPGNRALTNADLKYRIDADLGLTADELNARVRRKAADPSMRGPDGPYEEVVPFDGRIERPLLTMHGTGDLFVPVVVEQGLKRAVAASGNETLLVQRLYRIAGHCQFSQPEMIRAFDDLVKWVREGARPEGDDVAGDLSDAGRTFTDPLRANDPGGIGVAALPRRATAAPNAPRVDFVRDVQPIFRTQCIGCHGPKLHQNGFRLDRRSDAMRGGTLPAIGPGFAETSRLYLRLIGTEAGQQMPPAAPLKPEQIAVIKAWIDQGAEWPDEAAGDATPPPPDPPIARLIDALRAGDGPAFRARAAAAGSIGARRGPGGTLPLMEAAVYGSADDMRFLIGRGADVNARNDAGATALMWASDDLAKTQLLVDRGADVNAVSDQGRTALMIAAGRAGAAPVVKLLLERGANPSARGSESSVLLEASLVGDETVVRMLLDAGADVPQAGPLPAVLALKAGCVRCAEAIAARLPKPLVDAALVVAGPPLGDSREMPFFLDRGADVNGKDPQGRSVLTLAVETDAVEPALVARLIERGADVHARSAAGETAIAQARLRRNAAVADVLARSGARDEAAPPASPPAPAPAPSPRAAVERSLPLLQQSDVTFLKKAGCVSCHNNVLTAMTVAAARAAGLAVNEEAAGAQRAKIAAYIDSWRDRALQGMGIPGDNDTVSYILLGLAAEKQPADAATDALARFLTRQQLADGRFRIVAHRPPIESSDIQVTATTLRALQLYAPKADRARYERVVARAGEWLQAARPLTAEDRAFHLLGLAWAGAPRDTVRKAGAALVVEQRPDGGWAQLPALDSDAYATGLSLYALAESGALESAGLALDRGRRFLLNTQLGDGSWLVRSRAVPLQPLFESGFPHGRDQWISAAGTNWAALALARTMAPAAR